MAEHDGLVEQRAYALKAVIGYFVNCKAASEKEFYAAHPRVGQSDFDEKKIVGKFKRVNSNLAIYREEFANFRAGVQTVIDKKALSIPAHFHAVAKLAGLKIPDADRPDGVPRFIDYAEVPNLTGSIEEMAPIIRHYGGCWHVYRLSSRSTSDDERINVGFLSIKPLDVLMEMRLSSPQFTLYQRSEDSGRSRQNPSRIFGLLLQTGEFVTLLGERARGGRGMAYIGLLTWRHIESDRKRSELISGVSCTPNSEGQSVIGAYFCASYVKGSDKFTSDVYEKTKASETSAEKIGVRSWKELKKQIRDANLKEEIELMIERSRENFVFHT